MKMQSNSIYHVSIRALGIAVLLLLCAAASPRSTKAQTGAVAGIVTDSLTGRPLPGVNVVIEGTQQGAATDRDGRYRIDDVESGTRNVQASFIGYATKTRRGVEVQEDATATVDFALRPGTLTLDEVVAVGYGTQERRDITGAVASINVDATETAPITSTEQLLQGQAAGVRVVQNSGAPGGGITVNIRGTNSLTANNQPLYVIDGVPAFIGSEAQASARTGTPINPLAEINPNDIESIEILKDASATAIYGSRGANGVVLITTRRGKSGENNVQFRSSYGVQSITNKLSLLNARQYAELVNESYTNIGLDPVFTSEEVASFGEGTDWQEEVFRTAPVQNHSLTFSGGDERTSYLVSSSFFDQRGIIENSGFRRYSARLNLDQEMSDRLRVGNSLTLSRSVGNPAIAGGTFAARGGGAVLISLFGAPMTSPRDEEGNYVPFASPPQLLTPYPNPVATVEAITNEQTASRVVGDLFAEYNLTDALRFRASLGGNAVFQQNDYYAPTFVVQGEDVGGDASRGSSQAIDLLSQNIFTYESPLRDQRDQLDMTAGFTAQRFRLESVYAASREFSTDITGANALGAGAVPFSTGSGTNEWTLLSWLGRANYSLNGKYLFTFTGRYDGSSKFGENNKWGFFPSGAFAWRASSESFLQNADWLSNLKLRASYGKTGNQEIGTYNSLARLGTSEYPIGGGLRVGYHPAGRSPNPDLRWESTTQLDVGVDLGLFGRRVSLTADYYRSKTNDLLLVVELPVTTGFNSQLQNVGSLQNRGVELSVNTVNVHRENFTWSTDFNIATNRTEVVELGDDKEIFAGTAGLFGQLGGNPASIIREGEPLGSFYGYKTNGIWQIGDDIESSGDPNAAPGEYRYVDVNEDGVISPEDRTIVGYAQPDFFGGITNNFGFGPFSLDVTITGSYGGDVFNVAATEIQSLSSRTNETVRSLDRWTPENPSTTVPRANVNRPRQLLDVFIEDGSYLRLQNVTLGYQLPERLLLEARARVYISGQNLWTWTNYTGFDPEVNSYSNDAGAMGVDLGAYPRARAVNIGVNLTF